MTTETYTYIVFKLLNHKTGFVVRNLFVRRQFDNEQNFYVYNLRCDKLFRGKVQESSLLENYDDLPFRELDFYLDAEFTETQQWVLHRALGRL